jgi:hypothetical protein
MSVLDINTQFIGGSPTKVNTLSGPQRLQASILPLWDGGKAKNKFVYLLEDYCHHNTRKESNDTKNYKKNHSSYYLFEYQRNYDQFLLNATI